jgi:hypothetical protein
MDDRLRFAIENTRLIEVRCNGNMRVAEPHDYGVHKKVERLLAYQLRSTARSLQRRVTVWRLFDLSKIEDCVVLDATFRAVGATHTVRTSRGKSCTPASPERTS